MKTSSLYKDSLAPHPLDLLEKIVADNNWPCDRRGDGEMAIQAPGQWCDHSLYFSWNAEAAAMHFTCALDLRVPRERRRDILELVALINEKVWMGHFGMWMDEGLPLFRHTLPLRGTGGPTLGQLEDLMEQAFAECERFYPAFQYAIWGGKSPRDAVEIAMVETVGEA